MTKLAKLTGPSQARWNKAIEERVSFTSSVLCGVGSAKMLGLATHLASKMHTLRVHEMSLSKKFRLLTSFINMVGKCTSPS